MNNDESSIHSLHLKMRDELQTVLYMSTSIGGIFGFIASLTVAGMTDARRFVLIVCGCLFGLYVGRLRKKDIIEKKLIVSSQLDLLDLLQQKPVVESKPTVAEEVKEPVVVATVPTVTESDVKKEKGKPKKLPLKRKSKVQSQA